MVAVALFVPNLIGYARVIFGCLAFWYSFTDPYVFLFLYAVSQALDAVDGHAARYFNQSTRYGAVLDMVTDRSSTSGLLIVLGVFHPELVIIFVYLVCLDISSHYAQIYSTLIRGEGSHKDTGEGSNWFMRLYYGNKLVLFSLCGFNESMFLALYLMHFEYGTIEWSYSFFLENITWIKIAFLASLPGGIAKQWINVVQLVNAMKDLADYDVNERGKKAKKK